MIKIRNPFNNIEMSFEDEEDNNNNCPSENTKLIRGITYQCC